MSTEEINTAETPVVESNPPEADSDAKKDASEP